MIPILLVAIGLLGLLIASLFDIKTKEVPDWLNFSMLSAGISLRLMQSVSTGLWRYLIYTLLAVAVMFFIGILMYYTKQWGGGDTKLLVAIAAIFTIVPNQDYFLISLMVNLVIVSTFYGLFWCIYFAVKNSAKFKKELPIYLHKNMNKIKSYVIVVLILLLPLLLINSIALKILLLSAALILFIYPLLTTFIEAVERSAMFKEVKIEKLTEGDWITKDIRYKNKLIYSKSSPGIEKSQINMLRKLNIKYVPVKDGIPFVPAFLISTIITLLLGNLVLSAI